MADYVLEFRVWLPLPPLARRPAASPFAEPPGGRDRLRLPHPLAGNPAPVAGTDPRVRSPVSLRGCPGPRPLRALGAPAPLPRGRGGHVGGGPDHLPPPAGSPGPPAALALDRATARRGLRLPAPALERALPRCPLTGSVPTCPSPAGSTWRWSAARPPAARSSSSSSRTSSSGRPGRRPTRTR